MPTAAFIAGDWGTSHLRLSLCDERGTPLATRFGAGIGTLAGNVGEEFFGLVADWDAEHGILPAVMCGMVGSTIGWREAPYLPCPFDPKRIPTRLLKFKARNRLIAIASGLSCRNRYVGPDVMRGEETQILGALVGQPDLAKGRKLLCMPGTHSKWVVLQDGVVENFLTGVSGELFDILRRYSVLVGGKTKDEVSAGAEFQRALDCVRLHPDAELIHLLFGTRSRQLSGEMKREQAASYLSGLVVGRDVAGALRMFRNELAQAGEVVVVATTNLGSLYAAALKSRSVASRTIDGDTASLAGLTALHDELSRKHMAHAS